VDEEGPDALCCLISGPTGTPYESGLFLFDMMLPAAYPKCAPKCNLRTTGQGQVRFNPNLYSCGKVCLSLLGTWQGGAAESWDATHSSLLQLLISIQSLILIEQPYFNEPGYEREQGSEPGTKRNRAYSNIVRYATVKYAMVAQLQKPPVGFEDVVAEHFASKRGSILALAQQWLEEARSEVGTGPEASCMYDDLVSCHNSTLAHAFSQGNYSAMLEEVVTELTTELAKLPAKLQS